MSPHCILTEPVVSGSLQAHVSLTPGREGKGREQGREERHGGSPSSFIVTLVTRDTRGLGVDR